MMSTTTTDQKKTLMGPPGMYDPFLLQFPFSANCTLTDIAEFHNKHKYPVYTEAVKDITLFDSGDTYLTTGNPCLDFFFHVVPDTPAEMVVTRLSVAWEQDPVTALKLVFNLRGIRGTGKSDREGFYNAAIWLHENHPKTLVFNLHSIIEFGYIKDLLEILYRIVNGYDCRSSSIPQRPHKSESDSKQDIDMRRKRKRVENVCRALNRYANDDKYQFLHDRIAELFADLLGADMKHLESGEIKRVGLAAKWCPSLGSSFDQATLICESIACKMFPRHSVPEYGTLSDEHYAYRVGTRLRKEVLTPLRKALDLPEVHMGQGKWETVDYSRVSSLAMTRHKDTFLKHDETRVSEFLDKVGTDGVRLLPVGALLPHEILQKAFKGEEDELEDMQWEALVADLEKQGKFNSCIAMCSKQTESGKAAKVSAALSLLISELSEEPWKGRVVTLGDKQKWHMIDGSSVKEKIKFAKDTEYNGWDESVSNIVAIFDEILRVATEGKLPAEKMVKRVFVFSDMQFKRYQSGSDDEMADYQVICKMFEESGYGLVVPEIVFWNLGNSNCTPVLGQQKGVALLSGYSKNLLKLFLEMDGKITPEVLMTEAISGDEYQNLKVID